MTCTCPAAAGAQSLAVSDDPSLYYPVLGLPKKESANGILFGLFRINDLPLGSPADVSKKQGHVLHVVASRGQWRPLGWWDLGKWVSVQEHCRPRPL